MAASVSDLFKKVSRKWVGQIGAGGVANNTVQTIPLSSATNLPTDTAVVAVIDRVDANGTKTPTLEETIIGVVSGSNLINCTRGAEGTAQAHLAGAVVEVLITAKGYNDIIDGLLVEHLQTGRHGDICATTVKSLGNATVLGTVTASDVSLNRTMTSCNIVTSDIVANTVTARTNNGDLTLAGNGTGKVKENARYGSPFAGTISASACTFDMSVANVHTLTLINTSTTTLAVSNVSVGQSFIIRLLQNGSGTNLVTWFTTIKWAGGSAPTLTTTASKADVFGFFCTSAGNYDGFVIGQNL